MKLTKSELQKIVKEEIGRLLSENFTAKGDISEAEGLTGVEGSLSFLLAKQARIDKRLREVERKLRDAKLG